MFCCQEHLQLHRPATTCLPYTIEKSEENTRRLIASRDVKPGELVLVDNSLILVPTIEVGSELFACVECEASLEREEMEACHTCGFPLCPHHGGHTPAHQVECALLLNAGVQLKARDREENMEEQYAALATLRCLLASEGEGGAAVLVRSEMAGGKLVIGQEGGSASTIMEKVLLAGYWSAPQVNLACNYVQRFSLTVPGQGSAIQAVFPFASMLNQSCIANTKPMMRMSGKSSARLEVRATVPIKAGSPLYISRADPLLDMHTRRASLRANLTPCACSRCCDRTELKSFTSAMACLACDNVTGLFLPPAADTSETDYQCDLCLGDIPEYVAARTTQELRPIVAEYRMFDLDEQEDFLNCLLTKFHQNHSLIIQLKTSIAKQLGRSGEGGLAAADQDVLLQKVRYCEDLLKVLDIVLPGLTKERGLLLSQLGETLFALSVLQFSEDHQLASHKTRCIALEKTLSEAVSCLEGEEGDLEARSAKERMGEVSENISHLTKKK